MYRYLLVILLIALTQQGYSHDFFLSPPLPPTAFVGEYYTTQFRVLGLDNPVFYFTKLPKFLKGHADGTIEGTPKKTGSFPVSVRFTAPGCDETRDIVIRIAHSVSSTEGFDRGAGVMAANRFIVVNN